MTDRTETELMAELAARTRALPRDIDPPANAWPAIYAEIRRPPMKAPLGPGLVGARVWHRPVFLAAAGLLLVAGSSLITVVALRQERSTVPMAAARQSASGVAHASGPATLAEFASVENDYIGTANQLSAILESEKTTFSPETVAKLKQSLRIIDGAILEARRALAADPANRNLVDMLNTSYNQKLDLLRRTTEMGRS